LPPNGPRLARKLESLAGRHKKRAAEIAAMSPERRARYDEWRKTHKPGRRAERESRRRDREAAELLSRRTTPTPLDPEIVALEAQLAEVRAHRARLKALLGGQISTQEQIDE